MNVRSSIAALVISAMLSAAPGQAHAEQSPPAPWVAPVNRSDVVHPRILLEAPDALLGSRSGRLVPIAPTTDLRVSKGAKIAIIVGAIVVGVIILVGVFAIGPGHHGP